MADQLKEMQTTGADTHTLAIWSQQQAIANTVQAMQAMRIASAAVISANAARDNAAATNRQGHEMEQQVGLMRDQLTDTRKATKDSADAVGRQLAIADTQAGSIKTLADATALQLERTDRPYVVVSASPYGPVDAAPPNLPMSGMYFPIQISAANEGRSPATDVRIKSKVTSASDFNREQQLGIEIDDSCEATRRNFMPGFGPFAGVTIRPMEPIVTKITHFLSTVNILRHMTDGQPVDPGERPHVNLKNGLSFAPVLVGCVTYTIPYSTRVHHTPFAFDILNRPKKPPFPAYNAFSLNVPVPQEDIFLVRDDNALAQHPPD